MALLPSLKMKKISFLVIMNKFLDNTLYYFVGFFFPIIKIILEKYLIRDLEMDIFVIIHYEGIFQLICFIVLNITYIIYYIFMNESHIYLMNQKIFLKAICTKWILFPSYCIIMLILKILELVINKEFGPFYFILASSAFIFERFYEYIFNFKNNDIKYIILNITYSVGYTIGILIFSEIIILNFWKCGNTLKKISKEKKSNLNEITDFINNMDKSTLAN